MNLLEELQSVTFIGRDQGYTRLRQLELREQYLVDVYGADTYDPNGECQQQRREDWAEEVQTLLPRLS